MQYEVEVNGRVRRIGLRRAGGSFTVVLDGRELRLDAVRVDAHTWSLVADGVSRTVSVVPNGVGQLTVHVGVAPIPVAINRRRRRVDGAGGLAAGGGVQRLTAPMPGKVVRIMARPGDAVSARQAVVVVEAMKMENELRAGFDGVVSELPVGVGDSVEAGALLAVIVPA